MDKQERKARDADFAKRMEPRFLWDATTNGTAIRDGKGGYRFKPFVKKVKAKLTEAQDNALGRIARRRTNRKLRGWRPYAQR